MNHRLLLYTEVGSHLGRSFNSFTVSTNNIITNNNNKNTDVSRTEEVASSINISYFKSRTISTHGHRFISFATKLLSLSAAGKQNTRWLSASKLRHILLSEALIVQLPTVSTQLQRCNAVYGIVSSSCSWHIISHSTDLRIKVCKSIPQLKLPVNFVLSK